MTTDQPTHPLDLDAIHADLDYASSGIDGADLPYHPYALHAMRAAEKLIAEVERLRALSKPARDTSQPTPPFPLAEGDMVTVTMPARVAGLPDPEADPGAADELWDFAITVAGETEYVSLTQAEVIARVRKP